MASEIKERKAKGKVVKKRPMLIADDTIDSQVKEAKRIRKAEKARQKAEKVIEKMTPKEKSALTVSIKLDQLKHDMPRNAHELYQCLEVLFGHAIPYTSTADYCDVPFEAFCDQFFGFNSDIILVGPRGGGKTYDLSRGAFLRSIYYPGIDITHAGATQAQGAVAVKYLKNFSRMPALRTMFPKPVTSKEAMYMNGSEYKIVTGNMEGVSGQHPVQLTLDEIEFWDLEDIEQAFGVPIRKPTGHRLLTLASTRQRASSTMNYLVDNADKKGFKVYLWSIFESMENCRTCVALDNARHGDDAARMKECLLWEDCHGVRGRKATGFIPRDEVIKTKARLSGHAWRTQYLCDKPVSSGLVLEDFEHEMAPAGNYTDWKYDPSRPIYIAHDPSEGQTATAFFIQIDDLNRTQVFDELVVDKCQTEAQFKSALYEFMLRRGYPLEALEALVVDFHRTDAIADLRSVTLGRIGNRDIKVPPFPALAPKVSAAGNEGSNVEHLIVSLNLLRAAICNGAGQRNFLVNAERCPRLVHAIKNYSYRLAKDQTRTSETPKKAWSDEIDAVRYWVIYKNQISRSKRKGRNR